MREIEYLKQAFEFLENREDVPIDNVLEGIPDSGETPEFIEWLKTKPESLQANFLSFLLPFRKGCIPRLLEFSSSTDEEVSLIPWEALVKIDKYYDRAKAKLHAAFINEIEKHPNDKRSMILHCLREGLRQVAEKEGGVDILKNYRNLAKQKNANTVVKWFDIEIRAYESQLTPFESQSKT